MATDNLLFPCLSQLVSQAPILFTYLIGFLLALLFWRHCPGPSLLTLIAMGIFLSTSLVQTLLNVYLLQASAELGWDHARIGFWLSATGLGAGCLRAVAVGLLLAAVFTGRKSRTDVPARTG